MKFRILGNNDRFERTLRKEQTNGEELLWRMLRNRKFHGYKFRRQHRVDRFYLDFYCAQLKLAVEVDGSPHLDPVGEEYDSFRTRMLNKRGIRVVRFLNGEVLVNIEGVLRELEQSLPLTPTPSPRQKAGRGDRE